MLTIAIWCVGTFLEVLLLVRGVRERLYRRFPMFYSYLLFVAINEFVRISVYRWSPQHYFQVYWTTQYISLALGTGVIFEIYRVALRAFPGAARMTRYLLLIVFTAIFAKALVVTSGDLATSLASNALVLERNLRIVQALAMLSVVSLLVWYAIPFGRNLKGVLAGYGLFVGMSILQYAIWRYSRDRIKPYWAYAETGSYLFVLAVWVRALWSAEPVSAVQPETQLDIDYQAIVASTRDQFRRTLARLGWAARS